MDNERRMQRFVAPILDDLEAHLHEIQRDLLILEKEPGEERRAELAKMLLLRVRSLVHAADFVDVDVIKDACPKLAEIFEFVWDGLLPLNSELLSLLFTTADGMKGAGVRLREQQDLADCALSIALPQLDAMISQVRSQLSGPSAIKCPLCNSVILGTNQVDRSTLWKIVCYKSIGAIFHDLRNCAAVVEAYLQKLKIPAGRAHVHMESLVHRFSKVLSYEGRPFTAPIEEIEGVHQDLSEFFRFGFHIDATRLHNQGLRVDIHGYYSFVFAILQEILVIVGRISNPEVQLHLEVRDSIIVGQAALSAETEIESDPRGWTLAYVVAAVHHATIDFSHEGSVFLIRWTFPTCK